MLKPIGILETCSLTDLDLDNWMLSIEFNPEVFMLGYYVSLKNMTRGMQHGKDTWMCHMSGKDIREYINSLNKTRYRARGPTSPDYFYRLFGYEGRDALVELATKTGVYK